MSSNSGFDAQKMFELYLHDYFVKNNMHETAENFRKEVNVDPCHRVAIDVPDGFLHEWWCIFSEFVARQLKHQESETEISSEVINMTENQPQVLHPMVPQLALDQHSPRQFPMSTNFDTMIGEPSTSLLAAKFQGEELFRRSIHLQQQINSQSRQWVVRDNLQSFDFGRTTLMDPALHSAQRATLPVSGLHGAGPNGGVNPTPPNVWPFDAPNHQKQFQMSTIQRQQKTLAPTHSFTPGNLTSNFPGSFADFSCRNLMIPKTDLSRTNAQMAVHMRQTAQPQLQHKHPQNQQSQENGRRRNKSSLSRAKDEFGRIILHGENVDHMKAEDSKPANENVESVSSHEVTVGSSTSTGNKNTAP